MIGKKKKIKKKELQEDQLVTTFYKAQDFIEKNKQVLMIGIGTLAVIILAITWYANKKLEDNKTASELLAQVVTFYDQGQYQKAIDGEPGTQLIGLKKVADDYGGTEQGEIAKLLLANSYYFLGDYDNALEAYASYSGDSDLHKATSLAGQAACYEIKENYSKSAELYEEAAKLIRMETQSADYLLNAGINYLKIGETDKAKELFDQIKTDFNTSIASKEVDKYLAQL